MMKRLALAAVCVAGFGLAAIPPAVADEAPAKAEASKPLTRSQAKQAVKDYLKERKGKRYRVRLNRRSGDYYIFKVMDITGFPLGRYRVNIHTGEISRV